MYCVFRVDLCEFHQWRTDSNMQLWRLGSFESQSKKKTSNTFLRRSWGDLLANRVRLKIGSEFNGWWSRSPLKGSVWGGGQFPFLRQTDKPNIIHLVKFAPPTGAINQARHGFSTSFREQRWHTLSNPQVNVLVPKVFEGSIPFAGFGLDNVRWMQNWSIRTKGGGTSAENDDQRNLCSQHVQTNPNLNLTGQ